jgi:hypothetical protein
MATPRYQRALEEIASYLETRYRSLQRQGTKSKKWRCVTTCLTSDSTEDSTPRYLDWEACISLYVIIEFLTHNDGIRHFGFEGQTLETVKTLLVMVACAL